MKFLQFSQQLCNFQSFVYSSSFQIFTITETSSVLDREMLPSGFEIYHLDKLTQGGGALLAVYHSLPSHRLSSPSQLEIVLVEIVLVSSLLICVVSRPHACLYQDYILLVLRSRAYFMYGP